MSETNFYDIIKTVKLPSPQFLLILKNLDLNRLYREILIKEYQFRNCRSFDDDIQKRIYEKELGELYSRFMKPFKTNSDFETVNFPKTVKP